MAVQKVGASHSEPTNDIIHGHCPETQHEKTLAKRWIMLLFFCHFLTCSCVKQLGQVCCIGKKAEKKLSLAAICMVSGTKSEEYPYMSSGSGWEGGARTRKRWVNHWLNSSLSIQPFLDNPVPGTSPTVTSRFRQFLQNYHWRDGIFCCIAWNNCPLLLVVYNKHGAVPYCQPHVAGLAPEWSLSHSCWKSEWVNVEG